MATIKKTITAIIIASLLIISGYFAYMAYVPSDENLGDGTDGGGTNDTADGAYPFVEGWDIPGNIHYMVVEVHPTDSRYISITYTDLRDGIVRQSVLRTNEQIETFLNNGLAASVFSQQQYDCGMAQLAALGG